MGKKPLEERAGADQSRQLLRVLRANRSTMPSYEGELEWLVVEVAAEDLVDLGSKVKTVAGYDEVKADTFYRLNENNQFVKQEGAETHE